MSAQDDFKAAIDEATATEADQNAAADALITAYAGVPARIDAALASGTSSVKALSAAITAEATKLRAALEAPAPTEPPTV